MCQHSISRRHAIGLGLGAAAALLARPALSFAHGAAPLDEMDVALRAARWIRRSRIETKHGVTWPADPLHPESVGYDLYNGMPGVVLFHLELYDATHDRTWLDDARLGANEIIAQLAALRDAGACGLYDGLAGAAFVLEETHRATGDAAYRDGAMQAVGMIHALAQKQNAGVAWPAASATHDIISGTAGIGLLLLWAEHAMGDASSGAMAIEAGRHLIDVGVPAKGGVKWPVSASMSTLYPNFAHGTSGVGFFLARLYTASSDRSMYAGALTAARYLEAVATTTNGGFEVFHHEPGGEDLFYLSWCHGPAGTSRLFSQLGQIARRDHWNGMAAECAQATIASGVPERQSPGYWNNISQCCGNAGVGEFFIRMQRALPNPSYLEMIQRVSANTLARATAEGDGLKWIQAENRVSPNAVVAQTGYMQGAAGVGTYFLHAHALANGRVPSIRWPDAPTTGPCAPGDGAAVRNMSDLPGAPARLC